MNVDLNCADGSRCHTVVLDAPCKSVLGKAYWMNGRFAPTLRGSRQLPAMPCSQKVLADSDAIATINDKVLLMRDLHSQEF
jgi:hypothetical protein